jgi:hypothetical protein
MSERVLAAEFLVVVGLDKLYEIQQPGYTAAPLPTPQALTSTMFLFLILAAVAMFGPSAATLAAELGGLVLLAMLLRLAVPVLNNLGVSTAPPTEAV